jgi:hypothetical protein
MTITEAQIATPMYKIIRVPLLSRPGKPVVFDAPLLPVSRRLVRVMFNDLGNPMLYYHVRASDERTHRVVFRLFEIDELAEAGWSPCHVFQEAEIGASDIAPKRVWVLMEKGT